MATSRVKTSSILQGFPKSRSLLAGNPYKFQYSYEAIQTQTAGVGGTASLTFSSIPQTYTHLQIRVMSRSGEVTSSGSNNLIRFNGDSVYTNYYSHFLTGGGASATATSRQTTSYSGAACVSTFGTGSTANAFGVSIIDILDYTNTNKNKVVRSLTGGDANGSGEAGIYSGVWLNTAAITSITMIGFNGGTLPQYSTYALYGIKGV